MILKKFNIQYPVIGFTLGLLQPALALIIFIITGKLNSVQSLSLSESFFWPTLTTPFIVAILFTYIGTKNQKLKKENELSKSLQKQLNELLEEAQSESEENLIEVAKQSTLIDVASHIAHEIKNPLAIISGNADTIAKHKDNPEKFNKKIAAIKRNTVRIESLVNGLRIFRRINQQTITENHDIGSILKEVSDFATPLAKANNIEIIYQQSDFQQLAYINKTEVQQIFISILNKMLNSQSAEDQHYLIIHSTETNKHFMINFYLTNDKQIPPSQIPDYENIENFLFFNLDFEQGPNLLMTIANELAIKNNCIFKYAPKGAESFQIKINRPCQGEKIA